MKQIRESKRDINIMFLRIIAMLMVVAVHYSISFNFNSTMKNVFSYGAKGVGIFLMLSGYLNMISYEKEMDWKKFYKKKIINILPLYYISLFMNFLFRCFIYSDIPFEPMRVCLYIFGLNMLVPSTDFYVWNNMGALWTISVFLIFYLLTPFLFKISRNYTQATLLFPFIYLGTMIVRKVMQIILTGYPLISDPIQFSNWFPFNLVVVFWIGIILYYSKKENKQQLTLIYSIITIVILHIFNKTDYVYWAIAAVIVYIILDYMNLKYSTTTVRMIKIIDSVTFPVYLIHPVVLYIFEKQCGVPIECMPHLFTSLIVITTFSVFMAKMNTNIITYIKKDRSLQ